MRKEHTTSQCPYNMGAQWFRRGYGIHEKRAEGPGPALKNWELKLIDENLEYILLHELSHYKRKDVCINYLILFIQKGKY